MSFRPRESPPLPVPGPDARVLARVLGGILEDPEEAITAWIDGTTLKPGKRGWRKGVARGFSRRRAQR